MSTNAPNTDLYFELNEQMRAGDSYLASAVDDLTSLSKALPTGTSIIAGTRAGVTVISIPAKAADLEFEVTDIGLEDSRVTGEFVAALKDRSVSRLFVATEPSVVETIRKLVSEVGVEVVALDSTPLVSEGDFMSAEESEAVAERLKQLGYL